MNKFSKIGLSLAALYLIITFFAIFYSLSCGSGLCGLAYIIPLTPWPQIFEGLLNLDLARPILFVFFLMNLALAYYIGKGFSLLLKK